MRALPALVVLVSLAPAVLAGTAPAPLDDRAIYASSFAAADRGKWSLAFTIARKAVDPWPRKVLLWQALEIAQPSPSFAKIARFIDANPDWPGLMALRRRAEAALDERTDDRRVVDWFARHPPLTGVGLIRLGEAYLALGHEAQGLATIRRGWVEGDFSRAEERTILARHGRQLRRDDHIARLDRLLWDGRRSAARRMLRRVGKDHSRLALARLALRLRAGGVDGAIARVPEALRSDPGLIYERLKWRRRKGRDAGARALLANPPDNLVRPAAWWREAHVLSRRALADGLISVAYEIAANHHQTHARTRAQAEWLAGWIALRFLDDPALAAPHFAALYETVRYAISRARGAYWAGRAAARAGDRAEAHAWYARAAAFPATYYGQLALAELGIRDRLPLPEPPPIAPEDRAFVAAQELTTVIRALHRVGIERFQRNFVEALARLAGSPGQTRAIARLADRLGRPDLALRVARRAAREGLLLIGEGYPTIALPKAAGRRVEPALVLAMLRQESGFDAGAISYAGARGMLQLMPATARRVARRLGLRFSAYRLTADPAYNLTIGQAYLAQLLDKYDGSYVLALAAYNAGPSRVRRWIRNFGDPRDAAIDVVDWIETIPIGETRNYVQRVLEAIPVYRHVLGESPSALSLARVLERRREAPRG